MPNLLIVANSPSENTLKLRQAVCDGASRAEFRAVKTLACAPLDARPKEVLWANGIILGTTENFGYMSGLIKDFLERIYYPCREQTAALPVAVYVKGGLDGEGAKNSVERILRGLNWKVVQPTMVLKGKWRDDFVPQCEQLGALMAAGLEAGIF